MNNNLEYLVSISNALRKNISPADLADSMSNTQFQSKTWLVNMLSSVPDTTNKVIMILGSWYGTYLVPMLKQAINPKHIIMNDISSHALYYAQCLHGKDNMSYECFDAVLFPDMILKQSPDIIINTSCEHMKDMDGLVQYLLRNNCNPLFALQTCNTQNDPGHINPMFDLNSFLKSTSLQNLFFQGVLNLGHKKRFMIIGHS